MSEKIVDLQKEVFNKLDYPRTINTTFTELSVPDETDAEIEALRNEITILREDNLELEKEIITLSNPTTE